MVRTLSCWCRGTLEKPGTCNCIREDAVDVPGLHSRHECNVWDWDNLPLANVFPVFFAKDFAVLTGNRKWIKWASLSHRSGFLVEQGDFLIVLVLKVAIRRIIIVIRIFFVNRFLEVFGLRFFNTPRENFRNDGLGLRRENIECGGVLTIVKIRNRLQNVAVRVERLWSTNATSGVSVRVQDDLGVNKIPGRDSLVQSLAKGGGSRHGVRVWSKSRSTTSRIYTARWKRDRRW